MNDIGIIFDWDGVVVDSSQQHEESWEALAAEENLPLFEGHFKKGFGKRNQLIIPSILKWTDDPSEIERLGDRKEVLYRRIVERTGIQPLPGVKAFVESLLENDVPFAVGSSTPRENIEAVMRGAGIENLFTKIVAAADVVNGKPDPEVFLKAAKAIGVDPRRCIVFEDSTSGIEAGVAGGMTVVALATTHSKDYLERSGAAWIKESFCDIGLPELIEALDANSNDRGNERF